MDNAFEFVNSRPVRDISFCSEASTDDKIFGLGTPAIGGLDVPASLVCVELTFGDNCAECGAFSDVQDPVASVTGSRLVYKPFMSEINIILCRNVSEMGNTHK
jgi:hypothetical protein